MGLVAVSGPALPQCLLEAVPVPNDETVSTRTIPKREGNNSPGFQDFCLENGSSYGLHLALTVSFVPNSLDIGLVGLMTVSGPALSAVSQTLAWQIAQATARIWPRLSYVCRIRSSTDLQCLHFCSKLLFCRHLTLRLSSIHTSTQYTSLGILPHVG